MKRFSTRETLLLLAPVLLILVIGLWISAHPRPIEPPVSNSAPVLVAGAVGAPAGSMVPPPSTLPPVLVVPSAQDKVALHLHLEKPTLLQSFDGYDCVAEVEAKRGGSRYFQATQPAPYIELSTARGVKRIDPQKGIGQQVFATVSPQMRYPLRLHLLPPGQTSLGFDALATYSSPNPSLYSSGYAFLHGLWPISRTRFAPRNLAAMPKKPLIRLVSVKILSVESTPKNVANCILGDISFQIDSVPLSLQTPMEFEFKARHGTVIAPGTSDSWRKPATTPRLRLSEWRLIPPTNLNVPMTLSGRISANKRWPLGFETEPFLFHSVQAGQTVKVKQFALPLSKN